MYSYSQIRIVLNCIWPPEIGVTLVMSLGWVYSKQDASSTGSFIFNCSSVHVSLINYLLSNWWNDFHVLFLIFYSRIAIGRFNFDRMSGNIFGFCYFSFYQSRHEVSGACHRFPETQESEIHLTGSESVFVFTSDTI